MAYIVALILGVEYNQLYGITIAQILYIMFMCIYAGIVLSRKFREEKELEKVPIRVKNNYYKDDYEDMDRQ